MLRPGQLLALLLVSGRTCALLLGGEIVPTHVNRLATCGRRRLLITAAGTAAAAVLGPEPAIALGAPPKLVPLQPELVQILRVQEAAGQEARLVKSGKYKSVQRLNVKRAVNFMIDNYDLNSRFVNAAAYAQADSVVVAAQVGNVAVESLIQILEYFPDKLVANDLTATQKTFVLNALGSVTKEIDNFMRFMPEDVVAAAKNQIANENTLNQKEYRSVDEEGNEDGRGLINVPNSKSKDS